MRIRIATVIFLMLGTPAVAQMENLGPSIADSIDNDDGAAYEVFGKASSQVTLEDVADLISNGAQLYRLQGSAILVSDDFEPLILIPAVNGGFRIFFWCRLIPICAENP